MSTVFYVLAGVVIKSSPRNHAECWNPGIHHFTCHGRIEAFMRTVETLLTESLPKCYACFVYAELLQRRCNI